LVQITAPMLIPRVTQQRATDDDVLGYARH
jgi:hypothetical protein